MQRAAGLDGAVGEAVEFLDGDFAVVERAEHEPAAVGAEVAGEIMCGHGENLLAYLMRRANAVSNVMRETRNERRGPHSSRGVSRFNFH